jgi:hypothetical protein
MRFWIAVLTLFSVLATGQSRATTPSDSGEKIGYYLNLYQQADASSQSTEDVLSFVGKLEQKKASFKNTGDFLEYVFNKTHHRFLKNFSEYASFSEMLEKGNYNCLSGTALYALLLDHFEVPYKIIETNYHIFLLAQTDEGSVLFETTDPANGFVRNKDEIKNRIDGYKQNTIQKVKSSKAYYRYSFDLYNEVNLDQMLGLFHYNLSIVAYNCKNLPLSIDHLGKAMELYQSPRIEEFSRILLLSIVEGTLDPSEKDKCLESIRSLRKRHLIVTASKN